MKNNVMNAGIAIAALAIGGLVGCRADERPGFYQHVDLHHHGPAARHGHVERIHFASYKPTPEQLNFARRSIADEHTRETVKRLVDILRESTAGQPKGDSFEEYTREFDSEPVADAAYETAEYRETGGRKPAGTKHTATETHHATVAHHKTHELPHHQHLDSHTLDHSEEELADAHGHHGDTAALPLVDDICRLLISSKEYGALCRDPRVQEIIRSHPDIAEQQYNIDVVGRHLEPVNRDMVSDIRDHHPVDHSIRYVIAKLCVGPLPAACHNIATHH